MSQEIERKFRIDLEKFDFTSVENVNHIKQAYINRNFNDINLVTDDSINKFYIALTNDIDILHFEISEEQANLIKNNLLDKDKKWIEKTIFRLRTNVVTKDMEEIERLAYFTIKGTTTGISRLELEFRIDFDLCEILINTICNKVIDKSRYTVKYGKHLWEVDIFNGRNNGLIVAEIELENENEEFEKPEWLLNEVSDDYSYYNNNLIEKPYSTWQKKF